MSPPFLSTLDTITYPDTSNYPSGIAALHTQIVVSHNIYSALEATDSSESVDDIFADMQEVTNTNSDTLESKNMPTEQEIAAITAQFFSVVENPRNKLNLQILQPMLTELVLKDSLPHGATDEEPSRQQFAELEKNAHAIAMQILRSLSAVLQLRATDIAAAKSGDPAAKNSADISNYYPGIKAISAYRIMNVLWNLGVKTLARGMHEHMHRDTGIDIHPGATIGESFFIDHGTGTVIGETATIGNGVRLYHGVTLGASSGLTDATSLIGQKRHPTLEDGVIIFNGVSVLGGKTLIGAGSIINEGAAIRNVQTGKKATFGAGSEVQGTAVEPVKIGDNCKISDGAVFKYSTMGNNGYVGSHATVENANIGNNVRIESHERVIGDRGTLRIIEDGITVNTRNGHS